MGATERKRRGSSLSGRCFTSQDKSFNKEWETRNLKPKQNASRQNPKFANDITRRPPPHKRGPVKGGPTG